MLSLLSIECRKKQKQRRSNLVQLIKYLSHPKIQRGGGHLVNSVTNFEYRDLNLNSKNKIEIIFKGQFSINVSTKLATLPSSVSAKLMSLETQWAKLTFCKFIAAAAIQVLPYGHTYVVHHLVVSQNRALQLLTLFVRTRKINTYTVCFVSLVSQKLLQMVGWGPKQGGLIFMTILTAAKKGVNFQCCQLFLTLVSSDSKISPHPFSQLNLIKWLWQIDAYQSYHKIYEV